MTRADGVEFGFTDHDMDLDFDGLTFRAGTGLTARALEQTSGLGVDNSEAIGAFSDKAITDQDIAAGSYDNAQVTAWIVNWSDFTQQHIIFEGTIGDIRRTGGAFEAELLGLTRQLNKPNGRVFQKACSAVLGDAKCQVDLSLQQHFVDAALVADATGASVQLPSQSGFADRWFEDGIFEVLSGQALGQKIPIKTDREINGLREIDLWFEPASALQTGDNVRLTVGCDRRFATCLEKFANTVNFQGFPHIPGDDWSIAVPRRGGANGGGSMNS